MLVRAALVPETALLVPGAAGAADVLADVRAAALSAVGRLRAAAPDRLVVVGPAGRAGPRGWSGGRLRPTLAAAALADDILGWAVDERPDDVVVDDVGVAVALHLWARTRGEGARQRPAEPSATAVTVSSRQPAEELRRRGAALVAGPDRVAMLVVGSLSARRGPDAPLAEHPGAATHDAAVVADLVALGTGRPLGGALPDAAEADELASSVWAPAEVLRGAVGGAGAVVSAGPWTGAPFGATYAVLAWDVP